MLLKKTHYRTAVTADEAHRVQIGRPLQRCQRQRLSRSSTLRADSAHFLTCGDENDSVGFGSGDDRAETAKSVCQHWFLPLVSATRR